MALESFRCWVFRPLVDIRSCFKFRRDKFHQRNWSGRLLWRDHCEGTSYGPFHSDLYQPRRRLPCDHLRSLQEYYREESDSQRLYAAHAWERLTNPFESVVTWQSSVLYVGSFCLPRKLGKLFIDFFQLRIIMAIAVVTITWFYVWLDIQPTSGFRIALAPPYVILVNIMTCRVFRNTKLGLYSQVLPRRLSSEPMSQGLTPPKSKILNSNLHDTSSSHVHTTTPIQISVSQVVEHRSDYLDFGMVWKKRLGTLTRHCICISEVAKRCSRDMEIIMSQWYDDRLSCLPHSLS